MTDGKKAGVKAVPAGASGIAEPCYPARPEAGAKSFQEFSGRRSRQAARDALSGQKCGENGQGQDAPDMIAHR